MKTGCVPEFDGNHYESWSLKMKTFLKAIDLWDVVETGIQLENPEGTSSTSCDFEEESDEQSSKWMEMKDMTALYLIQSGLSIEVLPWIVSATSSKEAWELLLVRSLGGPNFRARKLLDLRKEYDNMIMSDAETIHNFTEKLMNLVFRMKSCGWDVEDKQVAKKILYSLPPRFDGIMVKVAETASISVLIDCLLVHEYNMNSVHESLEESVSESLDAEESLHEEAERIDSLNDTLFKSLMVFITLCLLFLILLPDL